MLLLLLLKKDLTDGPGSPTVQPRGINPGDDEKTKETRCTLAHWGLGIHVQVKLMVNGRVNGNDVAVIVHVMVVS